MRRAVALALALSVAGLSAGLDARPAASPPAQAPASEAPKTQSAKIWLGREAEFEAFLRTAPIAREESIPVGVTKPQHLFFAPGGLVSGAVFKPLAPGQSKGYFESYKSEIAAYELDKLLGLGMVPPTVERRYENEYGSLQLWVEHASLLKGKDPSTSPDVAAWNREVYRQRVWDDLVANIDRNEGNLLVDSAWNLVLIDHSRAFTGTSRMPFRLTRIDRTLFERLKALDEAKVRAHVGPWLFDGLKPLLERRDRIVKQFESLIRQKGEAAVLVP